MPDPWIERVSDAEDEMHPWGLNGGPAGLPPVGLPMPKGAHQPQRTSPRSPKTPNGRPLSPMSKKLLAPVTLEVWAALLDRSKGRDKILVSF